MRLWVVRHARPVVDEGMCYGALDVPAHEAETRAAARALATVLPAALDVVCSPLRRCRQLADELAVLRPDLTFTRDPRLAEMNFGHWEGRLWADIDRAELDAWARDFAGYPAGGNGESVAAFMSRVGQRLDESRSTAREQAWITHGGAFKSLLLLQSGQKLPSASGWPVHTLAWGEWQL